MPFPRLPFLSSVLLLAACHTTPKDPVEVPLTLKTFPPAYTNYALELADANRDGQITQVEWINAGGTPRSFSVVDENNDGVITRTELLQVGSNARFFDMVRRYADFNQDSEMTPSEFRSPAGARILRFEF